MGLMESTFSKKNMDIHSHIWKGYGVTITAFMQIKSFITSLPLIFETSTSKKQKITIHNIIKKKSKCS